MWKRPRKPIEPTLTTEGDFELRRVGRPQPGPCSMEPSQAARHAWKRTRKPIEPTVTRSVILFERQRIHETNCFSVGYSTAGGSPSGTAPNLPTVPGTARWPPERLGEDDAAGVAVDGGGVSMYRAGRRRRRLSSVDSKHNPGVTEPAGLPLFAGIARSSTCRGREAG